MTLHAPRDFGIVEELQWISGGTGLRLAATSHRPPGAGPFPALMLVHGFTGSRSECRRLFVKLARLLAAAGIASFRVDLSGSGESEGDFAEITWEGEVADGIAAWNAMRGMPWCDPDRSGVCGFSFGGAVAAQVASACSDVAALALVAPVSGFELWLEHGVPKNAVEFWDQLLGPGFFRSLVGKRAAESLLKFRGSALVVHGKKDETVPPEHSQDYLNHLVMARSVESKFLPEADHTFRGVDNEQQLLTGLVSWSRRVLRGETVSPCRQGAGLHESAVTSQVRFLEREIDDLIGASYLYGSSGMRDFLTKSAAVRPLLRRTGWDETWLRHWLTFRAASEGWAQPLGVSLRNWSDTPVPRHQCFGPDAKTVSEDLRGRIGALVETQPVSVADFGCGTAARTIALAKEFPHWWVRGFEPSSDMFRLASENLGLEKAGNVSLHGWDAKEAALRFPGHFHLGFSFLAAHFAPTLESHYSGIRRTMRRGAVLVVCEFFAPEDLDEAGVALWCETTARLIAMRCPPLGEIDYRELLSRCGFRWMESCPLPLRPSVRGARYEEWRVRVLHEAARDLGVSPFPVERLAVGRMVLCRAE